MTKNIIISVLVIIVFSTVFYSQSQGLEALKVKEQLERQLEEERKNAKQYSAVAEDVMVQMLEQKSLSDSLQQELNNCTQ